jgi:hypothetical protein
MFGELEYMDAELSSLLQDFLIRGGKCPLTEDD